MERHGEKALCLEAARQLGSRHLQLESLWDWEGPSKADGRAVEVGGTDKRIKLIIELYLIVSET